MFAEHYPRVQRTAFGVLLDRDEANDVAQEVFMKLHTKLAALTEPEVPAWLYRVTVNEALSLRRRLFRFHRAPPLGAGADPAHEAELKSASRVFRPAMASLSPKQRAVVTLHLDGDLSPTELAPMVGMTSNAARVTLHRALSKLREHARTVGVELPLPTPIPDSAIEEARA